MTGKDQEFPPAASRERAHSEFRFDWCTLPPTPQRTSPWAHFEMFLGGPRRGQASLFKHQGFKLLTAFPLCEKEGFPTMIAANGKLLTGSKFVAQKDLEKFRARPKKAVLGQAEGSWGPVWGLLGPLRAPLGPSVGSKVCIMCFLYHQTI